jgi:plastocyanin
MTAGTETKTAAMQVTVEAAAASASVTAPSFESLPPEVDVAAGGMVTWTAGDIGHSVTFTTPGAPAEIPYMLQESVSRTFPTSGSFDYHCSVHEGMSGIVYVH